MRACSEAVAQASPLVCITQVVLNMVSLSTHTLSFLVGNLSKTKQNPDW